jgi:hypothetical protein
VSNVDVGLTLKHAVTAVVESVALHAANVVLVTVLLRSNL